MRQIGIIVDGVCELHSLKKKYEGRFKVLKTDGPRGHCAPSSGIIANARKQIGMLLAFKVSKVIILLDFECRRIPYEKFLSELDIELKKQPFKVPVKIVVSNRMIENWFLADIEFLSKKKTYLLDGLKQKNYEGSHGKDELKRLFKPRKSYSETEHGPDLFFSIREANARKNSSSFKIFYSEINKA